MWEKKKTVKKKSFLFRCRDKKKASMTSKATTKAYQHDALNALKIFNRFCDETPGLVFYMSRDCDAKMYGYHAQRKGNELKEVTCTSVICPDFKTEEAMPDLLLRNFFHLRIEPIPESRTKYLAFLSAFPERPMTLHLQKNGDVISTGTLVLKTGHEITNVDIINIHMEMVFDDLGVPDILSFTIYGFTDADRVPKHLHRHCITIEDDPSMLMIEEVMGVTDAMRKKFDLGSIAKEWFLSSASK